MSDSQIDVLAQDRAAFMLYKQEHPESVAESWETVGLPIVLDYRKKANVVIWQYLNAAKADLPDEKTIAETLGAAYGSTPYRDAHLLGARAVLSLLRGETKP